RQQRKRSKQIEAAMVRVEQRLHRVPTEDELAAELKISLEEYHSWLIEMRGLNLGSLESNSSDDQGKDILKFISNEESAWPSNLLEKAELERLLAETISRIPKIEQLIL